MTCWTLSPDRIPSAWFNVMPHLPAPPQPPLHPGTREPVGPDDLRSQFDLDLKVYMVRASYQQKPYRKIAMETWGAEVVPSVPR